MNFDRNNLFDDFAGTLGDGFQTGPTIYSCPEHTELMFFANSQSQACVPKNLPPSQFFQYELAAVAKAGGLPWWDVSTASMQVSGAGNPAFNGIYVYDGIYRGHPRYRMGDKIIRYAQIWAMMPEAEFPTGGSYIFPHGSDYPYFQSYSWEPLNDAGPGPTVTRISGPNDTTVHIQRTPLYGDTLTDIYVAAPDFVTPEQYAAAHGAAPGQYFYDAAGHPLPNPNYVHGDQNDPPTAPGHYIYDTTGQPIGTTNAVPGNQPVLLGPPVQSGGVTPAPQYTGPPVRLDDGSTTSTTPVSANPAGAILQTIEGTLSNAVGGDGTIFGFSPFMVLAVAAVGLFFLSKE